MALWDLKARREGVPLYRLLGGGAALSTQASSGMVIKLSLQLCVNGRSPAGSRT
jgi:L-alanine-DL-glutamate epimerase-like enolase superfamily enzyme